MISLRDSKVIVGMDKKTHTSDISHDELARLMNQRPHKTLGWETPEEVMAEELAAIRLTFSNSP